MIGSLMVMLSPMMASAHVHRQDNNINVELHIPPDDRPTPKTTTTYDLLFEDEPAGFNLHDYQLQVTFLSGNNPFALHTITPNANDEAQDSIVFPSAGDYTIRVHGTSSQLNGNFTVTFPAHILTTKPVQPTHHIPIYAWAVGGIGLLAIVATAYMLERKSSHTSHQSEK